MTLPAEEVSLTGRSRARPAGRVLVDGGDAAGRNVRVLVVDDHRVVAESVALAIDLQPDLQCVGIAGTVAEALAMLLSQDPDVVLTDVQLPDGDGVDAARRLIDLNPGLRILVLTAHTDVAVMARAAAAGVSGFLPKETSIGAVLSALRRAAKGEMPVEGSVLSALLDRARADRRETPPIRVTDREREVLQRLSQGLDLQTIAGQLGISIHTCRGHVKRLFGKLDAHSQLEAVVKAGQLGLLPDLGLV